MEQSYKIGQTYYPRHPIAPSKKTNSANNAQPTQFNSLFEEKLHDLDGIKFSTHAKQRLDSRGITLDAQSMDKLNNAVNKAEQKGVKDSLILMKDIAFVVNIPNKVVVTTMDQSSMKEHIFTNIDGAIII